MTGEQERINEDVLVELADHHDERVSALARRLLEG